MATTAARGPQGRPPKRSPLDHLLAAFPVLALALGVLVFYFVEAYYRKTPWIFSDELEWTQISRSIADTGTASRRGEPVFFKSLYAYVIAPAWWLHSTATAYTAVKYINAIVMSLAAVPTYLLARMLVSRRTALWVAVGSIAVPAMSYGTSIVPEVLAYPYFALCSWLTVRAFCSQKRLDIAIALAVLVGGYFVRERQFTPLPVAFAIAAAGLWLTGPRGRALRRNWTRSDTLGATVLAMGALFLFNRVALQNIYEWQYTTQHDKKIMVDLGLRAALSLTIGLGVLPVIGGLASLRLPERRGEVAYRAYVAWAGSAIAMVSLYTAVKASYLQDTFASLWEERNLIYLCPLLLLGTALVLEAKRLDWRVVAAATAFVGVMIGFKPIQLGYPYFEAPGSAIPAALNTYRHWSEHDVRLALLVMLIVAVAVIVLRRRAWMTMIAASALLCWMVAGEITMTVGNNNQSARFMANLPNPPDWVDRAVHGKPVTYLGQAVRDANGEQLTEFWNRSIKHVDSLDGTAPGPGPRSTPGLLNPSGLLSELTGSPYVLADSGVVLDARIVERPTAGGMTLYAHDGPWHLLTELQQVYADGWCPDWCSYTYFKPHQHGTVEISLGRLAYKGSAPAGRATIQVGTVRLDDQHSPHLDWIQTVVYKTIPNGGNQQVSIPVIETPVRVEVTIRGLIPPNGGDPRSLGAQVGFRFVPAKQG